MRIEGVLAARRMLVCSGVAVLVPMVALAQSPPQGDTTAAAPPPAEESGLQEITVTARRREESLQNVPVSVTVASQAALTSKSILDESSLDKLDPALQLVSTGTTRNDFTPAIRGQHNDQQASGTSGSVITYFAEVPILQPNVQPQLFDLDSIQVLKGPQGTLFGETATGGVLLVSPKRPTDTFEGYLSAEGGDYNYSKFEGGVNLPLVPGFWSLRLSGQERIRDGYTTLNFGRAGVSPTDADNINTTALRVSSLVKPWAGIEISTVFSYNRSQLNGTGLVLQGVHDYTPFLNTVPAASPVTTAMFEYWSGQNPPPGLSYYQIEQAAYARQLALGPRVSFADNQQSTDLRNYTLSNIVKWEITSKLVFKDITGYATTSYGPNSGLNPDDSEYPVADNLGALGGVCVTGVSPVDCRESGPKTWTNEAQLQGDFFDSRLSAQGGFYYRSTTDAPWLGPPQFVVAGFSTVAPTADCGNFGLPGTPCLTMSRTDSKSYAVYDQETLEVIKDVRLTGGVRRTWDEPVVTDSTAGPAVTQTFDGIPISLSPFGAHPLPGATVLTTKSPENKGTSYTLGADWRITDSMLLWVNHRRGYKGGGVNAILPTNDPRYVYGPETVTDTEVGFRAEGDIANMPANATLVGFTSKYNDIQRGTFGIVNGVYEQFTQNVAAATIKGLEFSAQIKPVESFQLAGEIAYLDAKFDHWDETSTCAADVFYEGCNGVPNASVPVSINHATGAVTVNGITQNFRPDVFAQAPEIRFTLTPTVRFGFVNEALSRLSLTTNITHTSSYAGSDSNFTRGLSSTDILAPTRTLVDMRLDWHGFSWTNSDVDLYFQVTNLTNFDKSVSSIDITSACDCTAAEYAEPRMFYGGVSYHF